MSVFSIYSKLGYSIWFSCSKKNDETVISLLAPLWVPYESFDMKFISGKKSLLDFIVMYDQLSRHFFRGTQPIITHYTELAIKLSEKFFNEYSFETKEELLFTTLPLRHIPNDERIKQVVSHLENYMKNYPEDKNFCARILKATHKRYAQYKRNNRILKTDENGVIIQTEILESGNIKSVIPYDAPQVQVFSNIIPTREKFLLSLSGGVDSMVLACLMKSAGIPFKAYHINYGRRAESEEEANFLEKFCLQHEIPFFIEKVDNFSDEMIYNWEEATRQKRFNDYLQFGGEGCFVLMGHHVDDIKENLLMNLFGTGTPSGGRYLWNGLNGMQVRHHMRGVVLYRPLIELCVTKEWVNNIAEKYQIPYFKDTSFELATRIRIRRELLPLMRDIFGSLTDRQLMRVAAQGDILNETIQNVFHVEERDHPIQFHIDMTNFLSSTNHIEIHKSCFIDEIKPFFFKNGKNIPSHASIRTLLENVRSGKSFKMTLRGNIRCQYYYNNHKLIIYH